MIIRELDSQIKEHYKQSNNALLLTGARQVGKSYAIRKYGTSNYTSFVEINFIEQPQAVQIFKNATSASDLLLRISAFTQKPLIKGETLIFFDEVQTDDPVEYVRSFLEGKAVGLTADQRADGAVTVYCSCDGLTQKFIFTPI